MFFRFSRRSDHRRLPFSRCVAFHSPDRKNRPLAWLGSVAHRACLYHLLAEYFLSSALPAWIERNSFSGSS